MEIRTLSNRLKATLRGGGGALLLCLCLTACSSSDDEENVEPQLQISPVALSLDRGEGNAETLSLTCNTEWTATASADWLTVTPASGSGNASVVVMTNEENPEPEMRSATVTVTAGGLKKTVSVTQDAGISLNVTPTEATMPSGGTQAVTFDITTDVAWSISGAPDWLSLSAYEGFGNATVTATAIEANYSPNIRSATLTVTAESRTATIKIRQGIYQNSSDVSVTDEIILSDGWAMEFDFNSMVEGYYFATISPEELMQLDKQGLQSYIVNNGNVYTPDVNVLFSVERMSPESKTVVCILPFSASGGSAAFGDVFTRQVTTKQAGCLWDATVSLSYRNAWVANISMDGLCEKFYMAYYNDSYAAEIEQYPNSAIAYLIKQSMADMPTYNLVAVWGVGSNSELGYHISTDYATAYGWAKPHKASGKKAGTLSVAKVAELKEHLRVVLVK